MPVGSETWPLEEAVQTHAQPFLAMRPQAIFLLLLPLFTFAANTALAQRPSQSGIGYMGGPQAATWHSEAVKYRPVPGFVAGLYAPIWGGNRFELQPEFLISMQGAAKDLPDGGRSTMTNWRAVMPISLKIFLNPTINLQAGFQGSYLLLAQAGKQDITSQVSKLDMGMNIGAGIGTWYGLDITLRYYTGLTNALVDDKAIFPSNRSLQLTAGYRFLQFGQRRRWS